MSLVITSIDEVVTPGTRLFPCRKTSPSQPSTVAAWPACRRGGRRLHEGVAENGHGAALLGEHVVLVIDRRHVALDVSEQRLEMISRDAMPAQQCRRGAPQIMRAVVSISVSP